MTKRTRRSERKLERRRKMRDMAQPKASEGAKFRGAAECTSLSARLFMREYRRILDFEKEKARVRPAIVHPHEVDNAKAGGLDFRLIRVAQRVRSLLQSARHLSALSKAKGFRLP